MDQIKIGKYIASKRKALGMTQVQVAEKLSMSNKSVSKWERGVCLPDVSVYLQLCEILGISLNEFLAGEDLETENVIKQSEENIINVTTDGKHKASKLRKIIMVLATILFLIVAISGMYGIQILTRTNYIRPYTPEEINASGASIFAGTEGVYLYDYKVNDTISKATVKIRKFKNGKELEDGMIWTHFDKEEETSRIGTIAVLPDSESGKIKIAIFSKTDKTQVCYDMDPELVGGENHLYNIASSGMDEEQEITKKKSVGLLAIMYKEGKGLTWMPMEQITKDPEKALSEYDYSIYVEVKFR